MKWLNVIAACVMAWLAMGAGTGAAAGLLDDQGRAVAMATPPQRIVSLLPSLTETVCVLGACDRLVGTDRYSNWPAGALRHIPKVGGGLDPNIEAIVALRPDVVLISNSRKLIRRLEALGLRTVALEPRSQADVRRVLLSVGEMLHIQAEKGADRVWQNMQSGIDHAVRSLPAGIAGRRVYFEVSRGPFAAGPSSFLGELLTRMGMENIVPDNMGPFPRINPEWVVSHPPDVILMGNEGMQGAVRYPGWSNLTAVRQQRICEFDAAASEVLVRPGPRMDEVARIMVRCLSEKAPRRGFSG